MITPLKLPKQLELPAALAEAVLDAAAAIVANQQRAVRQGPPAS